MDENDPEYEPPNEWFTPNRTMPDDSSYIACSTRTVWATHVNLNNIKLPPPQWWLDEQDTKGREKSKFAIWHSRYTTGRRLSLWLMAPLEDFRRAKFLRPRETFHHE